MKLTAEQQRKAEENMGLVGKVIADKVHGTYFGSYTREDLFQIGCIGLCKAAATDKGGCFSTYAYRLIWNEICTALISATRKASGEQPTELPILEIQGANGEFTSALELEDLLERGEREATGVVKKGIQAMRLRVNGYSTREIGVHLGAPDNYAQYRRCKENRASSPPPRGNCLRAVQCILSSGYTPTKASRG